MPPKRFAGRVTVPVLSKPESLQVATLTETLVVVEIEVWYDPPPVIEHVKFHASTTYQQFFSFPDVCAY